MLGEKTTPDERKFEAAKEMICEAYRSGKKTEAIAAALNRDGFRARSGGKWTSANVSVVANKAGLRRMKVFTKNRRGAPEPTTRISLATEILTSNLSEQTKEAVLKAVMRGRV